MNLLPPEEKIRQAAVVRGVVQGVGFRPFVYRLASEESLTGFIGNDTNGVTIEVEGSAAQLERFFIRLRRETPPLARIDMVAVRDLPATGETGFRILSSAVLGAVSTGIPADAATCSDCLRELFDPADRRYRYPFLNCTNCGPRFTITRRIPYDRPQTSMAVFPMCPQCQREYDDPLNRRFHAQPNACAICGPHLTFRIEGRDCALREEALQQALQLLAAGKIVAIKGIGGFHLAADACNEEAVQRLRQRKHRFGKPLAVMVRDLDAARALCPLTKEEESLLLSPARPIVLLQSRIGIPIAPSIAPGVPWLGIFLPYAPLQHLLFTDARLQALVMTSANLTEEPIAIDNAEAESRLAGIADAFLMHNREILQRCDDSVAAIVDGAPQLLRRARGYVPLGVELPCDALPLLAVGGHMKNVFALARGRHAYQSQHLGDLENLSGLEFFRESLAHLMRTFEIEPRVLAHDMHPGYLSTQWAKDWAAQHDLPLIAVQHHHAHITACMAEHQAQGPAVGLALDGTGYGLDETIWGGEVLVARYESFERFAHLTPFPLPGGDKAVREPWRAAFHAADALRASGLDPVKLWGTTEKEMQLMERMIERGVNAPLTSSLGRLFDAVAAVVLRRRVVDYEAQAAIELEGICVSEAFADAPQEYSLRLESQTTGAPFRLTASSMWNAIGADLKQGRPIEKIASHFHAGVAAGFIHAALRACETHGLHTVALSGGCLHNRRLAHLLRTGLEQQGMTVLQHRSISPGDGGLSYGQAVVAAARLAAAQ